jgi:gluconokinase
MQFVLGIDIGTTHCKAVSLAANGKVLHEDKADYPSFHSLPGQHEQDAETIFSEVLQILQRSLAWYRNQPGYELSAICFSAAMHSILAVDAEGKPLTNAFTWADTRSNDQALYVRQLPLAQQLFNRTGTPIHPMSPLCKLMWLKQSSPGIFSAAARFISIKEYIFFKLFNKYLADHSVASATGLFDIHAKQWYAEALQLAGVRASQLSQPVEVTHVETELKEEYKRLLGIDGNVPFVIGASDGCLANLGSGAILRGEAALTIGTSGAIRMVVEKPVADAQQRLFNYILSDGLYVSGGAVSNGGSALQWFAGNFLQHSFSNPNNLDGLLQLAHEAPPGAAGLVFLPYLSGERAPSWDAAARGAFIGLQMSHGKQHLVRAVIEGISFALYQVLLAVEETNGEIHSVFASGGFTKSDLWLQLVCDVLNKKLVVSGTADASAIGAALLALYATGKITQWTEAKALIPQGKIFEPDHEKHAVYEKVFSIYADLYPKLKDNFHQLRNQ